MVIFEGKFHIKFIANKWRWTLVGYLLAIAVFCFLMRVSDDLFNLVYSKSGGKIILLLALLTIVILMICIAYFLVVFLNKNVVVQFYVDNGNLILKRGKMTIKSFLSPVYVGFSKPENITMLKIVQPKKVLLITSKSGKLSISEGIKSDLLKIYTSIPDKADMYAIENGTLEKLGNALKQYLDNQPLEEIEPANPIS